MWAYVENNQIIDIVDTLPTNWKNISNFDASIDDLDYLKSMGWYNVSMAENPAYDSKRQNILKQYVFENDNVSEQISIQNIYATESDYVAKCKSILMPQITNKVKELLDASDWTQLGDVLDIHDKAWVDTWRAYRRTLRAFSTPFLTNTVLYIEDVVFPEVPNA